MTRKQAEQGSGTMELCRAKGNTWYFADWQLLPLYRIDDHRCILLDTGLLSQRDRLEQALKDNNLIPVGILGSHAHTDHSPNHRYFQQKYGIPVALAAGEAALCGSLLNLKAYLYMLSPGQAAEQQDVADMELLTDRVIEQQETRINFCGVDFEIVRTPGHSPDHIAIRTPDDVLYLGDAILMGEELDGAKLPYFFSLEVAIKTMEQLRKVPAAQYLVAHRGICTEIGPLIDRNRALLARCTEEVRGMIDRPMTLSEVQATVCMRYGMRSSRPERAALYERNVRLYVEYLQDTRRISVTARDGVIYYGPISNIREEDRL